MMSGSHPGTPSPASCSRVVPSIVRKSAGQPTALSLCTEAMRHNNENRNRQRIDQRISRRSTVVQTGRRIDDVAPRTPNAANAGIGPARRENALQTENQPASTARGTRSHSSNHIAAITSYDSMTAATAHTNKSGTRTLEHCATEDCDVISTVGRKRATHAERRARYVLDMIDMATIQAIERALMACHNYRDELRRRLHHA